MFGLLNINKPPRWTSRDVVNHVEKMARRRLKQHIKVGHAGTLDPIATGVLIVCLGQATRLVPWLHDHAKSYRATFLLGRRSETDDVEAEVETLDESPAVTADAIQAVLPLFTGQIEQIPPKYSAIKIDGKRAYKLARKGHEPDLPPRQVRIHRLELGGWNSPELTMNVDCSSGTYIRSLGRDIAAKLGTVAVMSSLSRTGVGPFRIEDAVALDQLSAENLGEYIHSPLAGLRHLPTFQAPPDVAARIRKGGRIPLYELENRPCKGELTVVCNNELIAIARARDIDLKPDVVF